MRNKKNYIDLKNRIKQLLEIAKIKNKKTAFFISNTKKIEKVDYYLTPIRETKNYLHTGVVLFSNKMAKDISKMIDGKVSTIFVDTEKKSSSLKGMVNVEKAIKENTYKSNLRFYKANDLTVNAAEDFLNIFFKDDIRNISGKKILIIGAGNIGFKLGLKLVERGSEVFLNRRNTIKLKKVCETINIIKPKGTFAKAKPIKNFHNILNKFDIIFCASNNQNVISFDKILKLKKNVLIIDVGKGMFSQKMLELLFSKNIKVYRLNVELTLNMLVDSSNTFFKYISNMSYEINKINDYTFISNGILGRKGDIITDNPKMPKIIYGICNGKGDFLRLDTKLKKNYEKKISMLTKRKLKFY